MKKYTVRTRASSTDCTESQFDDLTEALVYLGSCKSTVGTIYRNSTNAAIYQIERGALNFDRRMKREK